MSVDAGALIVGDLRALRRGRARHFAPALALSLLFVGGFLLLEGLRPDLWLQPGWQIAAQMAVWLLCLVALPAVGVGLWFPGRATRVALGLMAVVAALVGALGPGLMDMFQGSGPMGQGPQLDRCVASTIGAGLPLLALGVLSGASAQRRRAGGALWVSGGVSLMALDAITWHCPSDDLGHNLFSHLGAAVLLLIVAAIAGLLAHRRQRAG
ncbi:hypothetical protein [Nannocystis sp.]|uniref:hypothetical protein n=1 Tax=Nannocystis sp. TaxID=1962667 RepID=UPI0025ED113E|nr:hypothetical protein [Nannocystis sp.]MBK7823959.1 hypothetical protein [Nannocystis sp.]